ncbi:unnamed protein product [Oppiella nova]|uniref:Rho-GAP domain-containing protein n=1 Tax=Oppiella nova TaxID=334625 RepID=A0A7R9LUE3_9ACAR|nr:unnamed protein product [Oppiella nova]CAG2167077.1 unnamed protein product [Oppiella nova]
MTFRHYPEFIHIAKSYPASETHETSDEEELEIVSELKSAVRRLPKAHFNSLAFLMHHLKRVSESSHENNMPSSNLGIVFGPTLLRTSDGDASLSSLVDTVHQSRVVELLITYSSEVFGSEGAGDGDDEVDLMIENSPKQSKVFKSATCVTISGQKVVTGNHNNNNNDAINNMNNRVDIVEARRQFFTSPASPPQYRTSAPAAPQAAQIGFSTISPFSQSISSSPTPHPKLRRTSSSQQSGAGTMNELSRSASHAFTTTYNARQIKYDDKDVIDLEKIGSTQRDETFNIWFKKMIFKPSVVFGSLGPELRPTYRFVIALQQKLVNGVYERVTKTYDWEERRREFRDCTDQQSRDIPLFISILNTTLHINAIFPFYDHNKYAVIFGGHPSGPRACLATTNLTDSLECSPDNLYFVINCDITYRTANTVLMIVVISLVIVFLCVVFLMFGVWFSCRNGKTDNINITQLKNTETASMASVSTINSNTGEQVSHTGSPNLRSKSITDRKCKASKKKYETVIDVQKVGSNDWRDIFNPWYKSSYKPSVAFGSLGNELIPKYWFVFTIQQTERNGVYERQSEIYGWNETDQSLVNMTDAMGHEIPVFVQQLDGKLHINAIFPFYEHNNAANLELEHIDTTTSPVSNV